MLDTAKCHVRIKPTLTSTNIPRPGDPQIKNVTSASEKRKASRLVKMKHLVHHLIFMKRWIPSGSTT
jgi:hypothetical protein